MRMRFSAGYLGIDLGTCFTRITMDNKEVIYNEPTLVALEASKRRTVKAIGNDAETMIKSGTKGVIAVHPIKDGMITDFDAMQELLKYAVRRAIGSSYIIKPKLIISIPGCIRDVDKLVLRSASKIITNPKNVRLMEKSFLAAFGCGLPVLDLHGQMIVDIGGGTTDIAVINLGGIVVRHSVRVGGNLMDESITNYIKQKYHLQISPSMAESIKIVLGSPLKQEKTRTDYIRGMDTSGLLQKMQIDSEEVREALESPCLAIVEAIKWVLERTPPDLVVDIMQQGIYITGGGSKLVNIDSFIANHLSVPVRSSNIDVAALTTVRGLHTVLANLESFQAQGTYGLFVD